MEPRSSRVPFYSTVVGGVWDTAGLDADYWVRNLRETVEFQKATEALLGAEYSVFIECSGHPVLAVGTGESAEAVGARAATIGSLRRGEGGAGRYLTSLAEAYVAGLPVDWSGLFPVKPAKVDLPTYPFQRQRYWLEGVAPEDTEAVGATDVVEATFWEAVERGDIQELAASLECDDDKLRDLLPALAAWRRRSRERSALDTWRYDLSWQSLPESTTGRLEGSWLLAFPVGLADAPWTQACARALRERGAEVLLLPMAPDADRAELTRLVEDLLAGPGDLSGVLSLHAFDEEAAVAAPALTNGALTGLALVQALGDLTPLTPLWTVTRGAVAVSATERLSSPAQAYAWGFGRVAALEYSQRASGLIDLPEVADERSVTRLGAVLAGAGGENQLALRPAGLFAARLVRTPSADGASSRGWLPSRGTVLITGGTGAIGAHVARWLARGGAEHLLLTSRRGAEAPGAAELKAELTALGAQVTISACDAADRAALADTLEAIPAEQPLTAVFHTAGVLDDTIIDALTPESMNRVAAGKALAARHLHELTAHLDLSAFVLFSSFASVFPSIGQGNYASANNYLDALVLHRRGLGLAGTSVMWGSWGGGGLAGGETGKRLAQEGALPMDPELAVAGLARALADDDGVLAVVDIDWSKLAMVGETEWSHSLLGGIPEARRVIAAAKKTESGSASVASDLLLRLEAMSEADQERELVELVRAQAAAALGHADGGAVSGTRPFKDLGVDSLIAVNLRNRVNVATGLKLPATLVFDHPTPVALARFLREQLIGRVSAPVPAASAAPAAVAADEPIAIVGMACRFPGGVSSPEDLWRLVSDGVDAIGEFPTDRGWDVEGLYDPDPQARGKTYVREGGFLYDAAEFDAAFFGISPREALAMDPQQRLLLETSWEAVERAGIDPASLQGSQVGVFAGAGHRNYVNGLVNLPDGLEGFTMTGNAASVLSGRIAYVLGLEGPAATVDTACSSSLVALHYAAQALRLGECTMALVGGAAVMPDADVFVEFSRQGGLAPDGRCKAFADAADGTSWSEGVGVILVERLSDARRNGHTVLAVVRGSAINQDGASNGLTAPNGPSQQRVIRQALDNAGLSAADVDVVEAHGTGTMLGDPIEAQALMATYGQDRGAGEPLWIGSIKSNIGHPQAAAGIAGVIKMAMALRHGVLPATLHVDSPSSHIDWSDGAVEVLSETRPWPETGRPRRSGVSAFGVSGTNAHVVLEQAPTPEPAPEPAGAADPESAGTLPWVFSGRGQAAVGAAAERLLAFLDERGGSGASGRPANVDVGWSLAATRSAFAYRSVVLGDGRKELVSAAAALATGAEVPGVVSGTVRGEDGRVGLLFAGQGAQRLGMGRELRAVHPVFAQAWDEVCEALDKLLPQPLNDVVFGTDEAELERTEWAQPALFAFEVALYRLVTSWGVRPRVLVGHSVGEIAAAHVTGVLSLDDACALVAARGRLMQQLPAGGAMVAIAAPEAEVLGALAGRSASIGIAAVNGPAAVVVSGAEAEVTAVAEEFAGRGTKTRRLRVSHAFHSPLMEPMLDEFKAVAARLTYGSPDLPVISTLTGLRAGEGDLTTPEYWVRHVREGVRFADAIEVLRGDGVGHLLEIGPDGTLSGMAAQCVPDSDAVVVAALGRKDRPEAVSVLTGLARVWVAGADVDWKAVCAGGRRVDLPTYPFQRERYWLRSSSVAGSGANGHRLLGAGVPMADGRGVVLTGRLSRSVETWVADHRIGGAVLLPGTAFVDLVVQAGDEVGCGRVEELTLQAPLIVPERGAVQLQVIVDAPEESGARNFAVYSRSEDTVDHGGGETWAQHAVGTLTDAAPAEVGDLAVWPPSGAEEVDLTDFYVTLTEAGSAYGPVFQGLRAAWRRGGEVFAEVALPGSTDTSGFGLHPALLDAALHPVALLGDRDSGDGVPLLPFSFQDVELAATGASVLRVRMASAGGDTISVTAADGAGRPVASIGALALRPMSAESLRERSAASEALFRVDWVPVQAPDGVATRAVVARDADELAGLAEGAVPELVVVPVRLDAEVGDAANEALDLAQRWLAETAFGDARLALVTRDGVLSHAAVWGLVRAAQSENPGRFVLVESDQDIPDLPLITSAVATGEPQLRLRGGEVTVPRLVPLSSAETLLPPATADWHLAVRGTSGTLDDLALVPRADAEEPLGPDEVRVAVRAAGVNFRDVLLSIGMAAGDLAPVLGGEAAGVVIETGSAVDGLAPGDRVFGVLTECFGPIARGDHGAVVRMPDDWTFERAAGVPVVFLTAWMGLADLAGVGPGDTVLVHAGAGGVGMAAIQVARHLGAEVFATASPGKWHVLRELGLDDAHIASSRTLDFRDAFLATTGGRGVDVVLNSLAGEFLDASLDLMPRGGRFMEMGKSDIRDPETVAASHPGVRYRAFDLGDVSHARLGGWLREIVEQLERGVFRTLPVRTWDVRRSREAFRFISQARHVGKVVLSVPLDMDPEGTVLITGGTGTLGGLVARHLVERHGARHILLVGRRGNAAEGVAELVGDLKALGAEADVVACDVANREAVASLLATLPGGRPLTAVIHAAGVVDDGVIGSLSREQVDRVIRSKVDAALHLDELTAGMELSAFVLFSSIAGVLGGAGQANYAAANATLDALAERRYRRGLPAVSMAWGLWEQASGMTTKLGESDRQRALRGGVRAMPSAEALALFDAAREVGEARVVPARLDLKAIRSRAASEEIPGMLRALVRAPARRTAGEGSSAPESDRLLRALAGVSAAERQQMLVDLVREQASLVLGHAGLEQIRADRPFREVGLDSLTGVELRNRLSAATRVRLAATTVFDYPTPEELAEHLLEEIAPEGGDTADKRDPFEEEFRRALADIPMDTFRESGVMGILRRLTGLGEDAEADGETKEQAAQSLETMDVADLVSRALGKNAP
ncbi:SDR family NAD(P)-dependent oxidoreductase [Streptomyces sp. DSM 41886]|uniref:SDR family NAD(P)-dependent oxidoreductase n=1 Tax=Streptomyces johnsoniae TaxID=3075532 RepID=A0ABU2SFD9_9ACTN|nr:SDR family NAD(P)-dependent oxidoreductase [Streptomyces sp. DSM 41886]MDT0447346.1 SDR family NAD(P)-dependent oxidoreductase [Streptomyces sp. DSM 41886]